MINNSNKLKAEIQKITKWDSLKSQTYLQNFFMERFLERLSISKYKDKFILKGGVLVAQLLGISLRSTIDIDATINALNFNMDELDRMIHEIINVDVNDCVTFKIGRIEKIMEDHDYSGFRFTLNSSFDGIKQKIRIDLSTGDYITPKAISNTFNLMFGDKKINLMTYNIETLLAEKIETILYRSIANTRMKDFYDVYIINKFETININLLKQAFLNTCEKRKTVFIIENHEDILKDLKTDDTIKTNWNKFKKESHFVGDLLWDEVLNECISLIKKVVLYNNDGK